MPDLSFRVERAEALEHAAVPSLRLVLHVEERAGEAVRSISLGAQVRIAAAERPYTPEEQERLRELFGDGHRWGETVKSLLWAHAAVQVPAFAGSTQVDLPVPCTYDFEVVSAKYFHAIQGGEVPLELLFSGSVFYTGPQGLQVAPIPWDREARFRMPVALWKDVMDRYFPNSAWLRLRRDTFDRLNGFRSRQALPSWEATVEALLRLAVNEERPWTR